MHGQAVLEVCRGRRCFLARTPLHTTRHRNAHVHIRVPKSMLHNAVHCSRLSDAMCQCAPAFVQSHALAQDVHQEYVACITTITEPQKLALNSTAAYQAAYAAQEGGTAICTVDPPVPRTGVASVGATLTVQPRYDADTHYSHDITLIAAPVPTAAVLRSTESEGRHVEVQLDNPTGLRQVSALQRITGAPAACAQPA